MGTIWRVCSWLTEALILSDNWKYWPDALFFVFSSNCCGSIFNVLVNRSTWWHLNLSVLSSIPPPIDVQYIHLELYIEVNHLPLSICILCKRKLLRPVCFQYVNIDKITALSAWWDMVDLILDNVTDWSNYALPISVNAERLEEYYAFCQPQVKGCCLSVWLEFESWHFQMSPIMRFAWLAHVTQGRSRRNSHC